MFEIFYHPAVLHDDFLTLNRDIKARLQKAIETRLASAPTDYGKPLRGNLKSLWRLRVGDYRIIYRLEEGRVIILQAVHRRDAYAAGILEARDKGWL